MLNERHSEYLIEQIRRGWFAVGEFPRIEVSVEQQARRQRDQRKPEDQSLKCCEHQFVVASRIIGRRLPQLAAPAYSIWDCVDDCFRKKGREMGFAQPMS